MEQLVVVKGTRSLFRLLVLRVGLGRGGRGGGGKSLGCLQSHLPSLSLALYCWGTRKSVELKYAFKRLSPGLLSLTERSRHQKQSKPFSLLQSYHGVIICYF